MSYERMLLPMMITLGVLFPVQSAPGGTALPCLIKPQTVVAVGSSVTGVLETVRLNHGDVVKQGDVVATLESSLEQAEVEVARGRTEMQAGVKKTELQSQFSKRKVARAKDLNRTSAIAQHELDEAETEERLAEMAYLEALEQKRLAELELKRAETVLALRTVRSPITGIVVERLVFPGELVRQTPIVKLAQVDPLQVEVFAPVAWLGKLSVGMRADVRVESPVLGPYPATVTGVDPVVDNAAGTFSVRLEMANPQHRIPAGLSCLVTFASK